MFPLIASYRVMLIAYLKESLCCCLVSFLPSFFFFFFFLIAQRNFMAPRDRAAVLICSPPLPQRECDTVQLQIPLILEVHPWNFNRKICSTGKR